MTNEFVAILSNRRHQEYGQVSVPLPIPSEEYDHILKLLRPMEIGAAVKQDCMIDEIYSPFPVLKRLENSMVNLDELDYLAKRLDGFCGEEQQFLAMAEKLKISNIKDLINLTFCCQQATVITDFSDLEKVGKDHLVTLNGGHMASEEYEKLKGRPVAEMLINSGKGQVTPYGVVYDNGMELEQLYDGRHFPDYLYDRCGIVVKLSPVDQPDVYDNVYLPCPDSVIYRTLERLGVEDLADCKAEAEAISVSSDLVCAILDCGDLQNHIGMVNEFCTRYMKMSGGDQSKLGILVEAINPESPEELLCLIKNLGDFTVAPKVYTPEGYGRYLIQESGHFDVDSNLDGYIDYKKYGEQKIQSENGAYTEYGYMVYLGTDSQMADMFDRGIGNMDGRTIAMLQNQDM